MAKKGTTTADLKAMGLFEDSDGFWKKRAVKDTMKVTMHEKRPFATSGWNDRLTIKVEKELRKITLNLFGEPMPKQSVRAFIKNGTIQHYQPQETVDRTQNYIKQIKLQLPKDFTIFETRVHITKMHFIFKPLKAFHKIKGRMAAIEAGEIFYKETKPDLPDNLKKLVNDAMSGIVYKDDSIIVSEDNVKKYYGMGGMIIIELQGY